MEDFDKNLSELKELVKSFNGDSDVTEEEVKELLAKSEDKEEQAKAILDMVKAKTSKKPNMKSEDEEDEDEEDEDEGEEDEEKKDGMGKGGQKYGKSLVDDFSDLEKDAIDAEPILKSMLATIQKQNEEIKALKKSQGKDAKYLASMAKVISDTGTIVKSIQENVDFLGGLPQNLKGQFLSISKEQKNSMQKSIVDRFGSENTDAQKEVITPAQMQHAMSKAYQEGKLKLVDITMEGNAGFSGASLNDEKREIIKSYLTK